MTEKFFQVLTDHIQAQTLDLNTGETILEFLYECYYQFNNLDDAQIKADFDALYENMNGMTLRERWTKLFTLYAAFATTTNVLGLQTELWLVFG
ncbi:hypothetical protein EII17_13385 [Clostridiales bacterium COT073_COT-073]|nr:hypothetical protein EII17_13385 [Clostridiales bacterium COT073_COT-073]